MGSTGGRTRFLGSGNSGSRCCYCVSVKSVGQPWGVCIPSRNQIPRRTGSATPLFQTRSEEIATRQVATR